MTKQRALLLLHENMSNLNLRKHCYAVGMAMKALAKKFNEDEELWETAGIIHDLDYELNKDNPHNHPSQVFAILERENADPRLVAAVKSHAWGWRPELPEPQTPLEWALYTSDELTGFIIACALVRPDKRLASVTVDSVLKKWPQKAFAAGVHRKQIELCESKLGIPLPEFIGIILAVMQQGHEDLGL
jgi:hypothetical protein